MLAGVGWAGVTIFFALSGFLLTKLYFEEFRRGLVAAEVKSYLLKRVARIYPLYFALLGFTVLLWSLGVDTGVRDPSIVGWNIASHLVLLHGYFGSFCTGFIAPAWSLTIEESFYLLLPVACLVVGRFTGPGPGLSLPRFALGLAAFTAACLLWGYGVVALWRNRPYGLFDNWINQTIFGQMPTFALGMLAGVLWRYRPRAAVFASPWWSNLAGTAGVAMYVLGADFYAGRLTWMEGLLGQLVFASSGALFIVALCGRSVYARVLGFALPVYGGRISYAFYLIHTLQFLHPAQVGVYHPVVTYVYFQLLAAVLYELIEKRAHRWLRARWEVSPRAPG